VNSRHWLRLFNKSPESTADHRRNLEQIADAINTLPFGSTVAKYVRDPAEGFSLWMATVPNFSGAWTPLPFRAGSGTFIKSNSDDGKFRDDGFLVTEGGWWEFHWTPFVLAIGSQFGFGSALTFNTQSNGIYNVTVAQEERGVQFVADANAGLMGTSSAIIQLPRDTLVQVCALQNSGASRQVGIWQFAARRVLER